MTGKEADKIYYDIKRRWQKLKKDRTENKVSLKTFNAKRRLLLKELDEMIKEYLEG